MPYVLKCQKCGAEGTLSEVRRTWLCSLRKDGKGLIIRCPSCTTRYAKGLADRDYTLKN